MKLYQVTLNTEDFCMISFRDGSFRSFISKQTNNPLKFLLEIQVKSLVNRETEAETFVTLLSQAKTAALKNSDSFAVYPNDGSFITYSLINSNPQAIMYD